MTDYDEADDFRLGASEQPKFHPIVPQKITKTTDQPKLEEIVLLGEVLRAL
jgi:hypothetical protein